MSNFDFNSFLDKFKKISTFIGRINFANEHLEKIGSGSGRVVYKIDDYRVFKIAKNNKGVAQNEVEIRLSDDIYAPDIITKIYEYADDYSWIIAERAKKISLGRFRELTNVNDLYKLKNYLECSINPNKCYYGNVDELNKIFDDNEFAQELLDLVVNFSISVGDFGRLSSYGEVVRDGESLVVITDYGLNDEVYEKHYNPQRKGNLKLYEVFPFFDGNYDILSNVSGDGDIRKSMWALLPYGVGDGINAVNENFVNFVLKNDKYPSKPIKDIYKLENCYVDCVSNLKNILINIADIDDRKRFITNLVKLQEYLNKHSVFGFDEILTEDIDDDAIPKVDKYNSPFVDLNYWYNIANDLSEMLGLGGLKYIKGGGFGHAYRAGDKVLKLTVDPCEIDSGIKIMGVNNAVKHLVHVYKLYKVFNTKKNLSFFILVLEYIDTTRNSEFKQYYDVGSDILKKWDLFDSVFNFISKLKNKNYTLEMYKNAIDHILTDDALGYDYETRKNAHKFWMELYLIKNEINELNIKSTDYLNWDNLGYRGDVLVFFDLGGCRPDENVENKIPLIKLPENVEYINENLNYDEIANKIANKLNIKVFDRIGAGNFGVAYDIGNNLVMKITNDSSEAYENLKLIGKPLKYIAQPYKVYNVNKNDNSVTKKLYVIILEKLKTSSDIRQSFERLTYVFKNIFNIDLPDAVEHFLDIWKNDKIDVNKINAYFRKNPHDAEFFNGLLNIGKELMKYDIVSMDYLKWENLGYKNNNIAFFDVGFGNYFNSPDDAETIDIDEDGSSLYSTTNTIGNDDYPVYNQDNIPPTIDNNIDVNTAIYSENKKSFLPNSKIVTIKKKCKLGGLGNVSAACNQGDINNLSFSFVKESVGDKLFQNKFQYKSDFDDFEKKYRKEFANDSENIVYSEDNDFFIIKNPNNINNLDSDVRAIGDDDGNLYVESYPKYTHSDMHNILRYKGVLTKSYDENWHKSYPKNYIYLQRIGDTQIFVLAESYLILIYDDDRFPENYDLPSREEVLPVFKLFLDKLKQKNPNIDFVNEYINYYVNENINENDDMNNNGEKYYRAVDKYLGKYAKFKPNGYYEAIDDNNNPIFKYDSFWESEIPEIAASKLIGGAIMGLYSMYLENKKTPKTFYIYEINEKPDIDISHWNMGDFAYLKEVRYRRPVSGRYVGKFIFDDDTIKRFEVFYEINNIDGWGSEYDIDDETIELFNKTNFGELLRDLKNKLSENNKINENDLIKLHELPFKDEIKKLGGKIYSVGGAVRDEFLGKKSKDLDLLITGIPMNKLEEILSKYGRVDVVGKSFGILKFKPNGFEDDIDIAIPRTERPTGAGGHKGFEVISNHELPIEKDLERRDFTINAIAKDINGNIIDPYGGVDDLKNKIIRIVNPDAFSDDPLRMLRAVQFASRFGFNIEPKTLKMIQNNAHRINEIPSERILTEFDKIIKKGDCFTGAFLLKQTGLLKNIFGKDGGILINDDVWNNVRTMGEFIYLLSHNIVDNPAEFYKKKLKGDIDTYKEIRALQLAFEYGDVNNPIESRSIAHNMYVISPKTLDSMILPNSIKIAANELLSGKYPKTINELKINGNDLISMGLKDKEIGKMLKQLLLKIYADKIVNDKKTLLDFVKNSTQKINENGVSLSHLNYSLRYPNKDVLVFVPVDKLLSRHEIDDPDYAITNKNNQIGNRVERAKEFLQNYVDDIRWINPQTGVRNDKYNVIFEPSIAYFYNNKLKFSDGRHRILAAKELGYDKVALEIPQEQLDLFVNELDAEIVDKKINEGKWYVDGKLVDINFFIKKFDEWNQKNGGKFEITREVVKNFLISNFKKLSNNKWLFNELVWALNDRDLLNENLSKRDNN